MRLFDLFEDDDMSHSDALEKTGFWGVRAAGCIFLARSTGRLLINHRSNYVQEPGSFGSWGGAIDSGEDPEEAVHREIGEEAGYYGHVELVPLLVFKKGTFRYFNFLAIVDEEFTPKLDRESQGYVWCEFGDWPSPLHFGLVTLLNDSASVRIIQREIRQSRLDESQDDFQQWFSGSKVVDKDGNPLICYHGSSENINSFWSKTHFGTEVAAKQRLRDRRKEGNVHAVYLQIKNPLKVTDAEASDEASLLNAIVGGKYPKLDASIARKDGAYAACEAAGYDGLVYNNRMEHRGRLSWVIFNPNQARLASR